MDNDVTVWFEIDGSWVDFTRISDRARVLVGDGEPGITLSSELSGTRKISFRYLDSDGLLDGQNPGSPYYGKIGPGTPVRVQCDGVTQQVGEIAADGIKPSWNDGAHHADGDAAVMVEVSCTDIVGRLGENDPPLESALTRFHRNLIVNYSGFTPHHWYTFEEGPAATRAEDQTGGVPLTGIAEFGNDDGPPGAARALQTRYEARTAPVPDRSTSLQAVGLEPPISLSSGLFSAAPGTDWTLEVCGKFPAVAVSDDTAPAVLVEWRTHGLAGYWQIRADYVTKCWEINFFNTPASLFTITTDVLARDNEWHIVRVEVEHNAPNFDVLVYIDGVQVETFPVIGAYTSPPKSLFISNFEDVDPNIRPAISHLTTWAGRVPTGVPDPYQSYEAMIGHAGDITSERFSRLLIESDISFTNASTLDMAADKYLGPQDELPLLEVLQQAADSDASWWFSHRTSENRIAWLSIASLYNQAPAFWADYAHLSPPFNPVPNDQVANLIKATNQGAIGAGAEVEHRIEDDDPLHWTTQIPARGGAYVRPDSARVNLQDDAGVVDVAAWRAHERAWKEKRYTALTYELHRDAFTADDIAAVRSLDLGSMIAQGAVGSPPWIPYTELRGLVRGWSRTLGKQTDTWTIDTVPADIYEVITTDTSGSTLAAGISSSATSALLATSSGPPWSDTTQKLQIGGDAVGVSAMALATRTYIGAGAMAHADNAAVAPALPAGMTPDVGQSIYCFAAIRNSSATLPATVTGWTTILTGYAEIRLYHRYYKTGDVAPTITPSGGAAGDSVSAVCFAFAGTSPHTDNTDGNGGVWASSNASAQNFTFAEAPVRTTRKYGLREEGVVHLLLGWKQDDWTSVAPPASYTEMFDGSTTLGNDQGLWGAYRSTATATAYPGTAVVVTGGVAAISKTFVVALRPLQQATITRGIANTPAAKAEGALVNAWHLGVRAL